MFSSLLFLLLFGQERYIAATGPSVAEVLAECPYPAVPWELEVERLSDGRVLVYGKIKTK